MQTYKTNIAKQIETEIQADIKLDLDSASAKRLVDTLSRVLKGSKNSLQLKAISASEKPIVASLSLGLFIQDEDSVVHFSFNRQIPLKIKITEPVELEFTAEDQSCFEDNDFTDLVAELINDSEVEEIIKEFSPPPVPTEEDPEAEWKKLKKGVKKAEDPNITVSVFSFLTKHYQKISRKDVDAQLTTSLDEDASYVEEFITQSNYYFLDTKKHKLFQQSKNLSENVKTLLRDNRNANSDEKIYTYADLDKLILEFGLAEVVGHVRSGLWTIEDELDNKDITKLLSKGIITTEDIENLYIDGSIYGIELEKIVIKKKISIKNIVAFKKILEDAQISEEFKAKQQELWYKHNPDRLVLSDDLNALKVVIDNNEVSATSLFDSVLTSPDLEDKQKTKKAEFLIKNYQIRLDQIIRFLRSPTLFSEECNQIIMNNPQIIIDGETLFHMIKIPLMKPEVKKVLEDRLVKAENKQEQMRLVSEYKRYIENPSDIKSSEFVDVFDKASQLYKWAGNVDTSISTGISSTGPTSGMKYDKEGFEVLSTSDISGALLNIMKTAHSATVVEYVYANELIPIEFKIFPILENSACPLKIIQHYIDKNSRLHLLSILKNKTLPESILEDIFDRNIFENDENNRILQLILSHPHCSARLAAKLKEGIVSLMEQIRSTKDSTFLYNSFLDLYSQLKGAKIYPFNIPAAQNYRLMEACVLNHSAPASVLSYFCRLLGLDDKDARDIILSHPQLDLELLSKYITRFPQSEEVNHAFKKNPNWKQLSLDITKAFFEVKQLGSRHVPVVVLDVLQKFSSVEDLASFLKMDAESEEFVRLLSAFDDLKLILKKQMFEKYLVLCSSSPIEKVVQLMVEIKNPDFGFFDGVLKINEAERQQLMDACRSNPAIRS